MTCPSTVTIAVYVLANVALTVVASAYIHAQRKQIKKLEAYLASVGERRAQ